MRDDAPTGSAAALANRARQRGDRAGEPRDVAPRRTREGQAVLRTFRTRPVRKRAARPVVRRHATAGQLPANADGREGRRAPGRALRRARLDHPRADAGVAPERARRRPANGPARDARRGRGAAPVTHRRRDVREAGPRRHRDRLRVAERRPVAARDRHEPGVREAQGSGAGGARDEHASARAAFRRRHGAARGGGGEAPIAVRELLEGLRPLGAVPAAVARDLGVLYLVLPRPEVPAARAVGDREGDDQGLVQVSAAQPVAEPDRDPGRIRDRGGRGGRARRRVAPVRPAPARRLPTLDRIPDDPDRRARADPRDPPRLQPPAEGRDRRADLLLPDRRERARRPALGR